MDLTKLSNEELLKLKEEIGLQIKYNNERVVEIQKSREKSKLSDLDKDDKIFCINFKGSKINAADYVKIMFYKKDGDDVDSGFTNYSSLYNANPIGCSSSLPDECMSNHCFLAEFSSCMYFFTLKPENWKEDLKIEEERSVKIKLRNFQNEIKKFKLNIRLAINSDKINEAVNYYKIN